MEIINHTLNVESKKKAFLTAVLEVLAFSEKEIKLKLKDGEIVFLNGDNLKIVCFDSNSGNFTATGTIASVRYRDKSTNLIKKVLK